MKKIMFSLVLTILLAATVNAQKNKKDSASNILTDWMDLHCQLVRKSSGITHVAYSRHFSYTAIAVYESIVKKYPANKSLTSQLNGLTSLPGKDDIDPQLTVNTTYAEMLRAFYATYPGCKTSIDSMEKLKSTEILSTGLDKKTFNNSKAFGKAVANHILNWANTDGADNAKAYVPLKGVGLWTPSPSAAAPFWYENRNLTPGLFNSYSMKPPAHSTDPGSDFYKMAGEVYETGKQLTDEQKKIAWHWDDSPNGKYLTVFGHWTSILSGLIKQNKLSLVKASEAYAKMTIALHDACLIAWKGKYQYVVLRPETFIQQQIDKTWTPLINTPPHPEFPAAHATLSYAAATILQTIFGDECIVNDDTYASIGMEKRSYPSLLAAAREAGISRLYGGIHYRYSIEQGFIIGKAVAELADRSISFHLTK